LDLGSALLALWIAGFLIIGLCWFVRWWRVRVLLHEATAAQVDAPIAVKFSPSGLEPGLVGILRPVILLPQGIEQQLSPAELKAVLAHELSHWRRHDNLLAAIHMLVEALFWFFPLVWWLGARLNAERERACDESVLADGNDPMMYAEGILKVCRVYLQSPLACVSGVSGAGLKKRIDAIMENRLIPQLNAARKFILSASAALALVLPLMLGLAAVPILQMQAKAVPIGQRNVSATASPVLNQRSRDNLPGQQTSSDTQSQSEALAKDQSETLAPPSPDLSGVLSYETLATPAVVASNDARAASNQPAAAAPAPNGATDHVVVVVVANTPSGVGDPDAIVCRAPQQMVGSDKLGPEACGHNYEWQKLALNGKDLAPDGKTLIARPTVDNPKGDGDPDAMTCRTPKVVSSPQDWVKRFSPEVCRTNRFWADVIKNHQMVDTQGVIVTRRLDSGPIGSGDTRGINGWGVEDSGHHSQSSATP
jgi:hypothetical protein